MRPSFLVVFSVTSAWTFKIKSYWDIHTKHKFENLRNTITTCKSAQSFLNDYASNGFERKGEKECTLQARDTSLDTGYYILYALAPYVKTLNCGHTHFMPFTRILRILLKGL